MSNTNYMRRYLFKLKKYLPKFLQTKHKPSEKKMQNLAKRDPLKPQQTALLVAYCGKNYHGVNFSWEVPTIEHEVLKVLHDMGLIPPIESGVQRKIYLQRVSRTDKGVSAAGNMILIRMLWTHPNFYETVNEKLPPDIRVIDYLKAPRNFVDHQSCLERTYSYTLPSLAFAPIEERVTPNYRVSMDTIERVNGVLEKFWSSHNFHNFTSHKEAQKRNPWRVIQDFECGLPLVVDGVEFCTMRIRGQSFMLHQIRKMIGLTIAIVRGFCDEDVIDLCWEDVKVDIPKAPGLGLVLEKLHFSQMENLFGGYKITDERRASTKAMLDDFRENHIRADIVRTEIEENRMLNWLKYLHFHLYHAINLDGTNEKKFHRIFRFLAMDPKASAFKDIDDDQPVDDSAVNNDDTDKQKDACETLGDLELSVKDNGAGTGTSNAQMYEGREARERTLGDTSLSEETATEHRRKQSV